MVDIVVGENDDGNDVDVDDCGVDGRVPLLLFEVIVEGAVVGESDDGIEVVEADCGVDRRFHYWSCNELNKITSKNRGLF